MAAYYNEIEPYAAEWLRNLIARGVIAPGDVDERDIRDVKPSDIAGYTQCHFFAGVGVWSYALRLAGWPDDEPVWTGSCPCQPFSTAGAGLGFADERHLWPFWHHLIRVRRPDVVFGEQVASLDGLGWLDLVQTDLEGEDYACGPVDFCAAGVGAPHIRQRLWWVADADRGTCRQGREIDRGGHSRGYAQSWPGLGGSSVSDGMADANTNRRLASSSPQLHNTQCDTEPCGHSGVALGDASGARLEVGSLEAVEPGTLRIKGATFGAAEPVRGFWRGADWIWCRDGKYRPVEPGSFPLADGAPARVGRLRAYGNAIVAEAAAKFIEAFRYSRFPLV